MRTHSCEPTLNDSQVLEFCANGFIVLERVVADEINSRMMAYLEEYRGQLPSEILHEEWFVDAILLNREAIGAARSLLGNAVGLPVAMANHRVENPQPAQHWHRDGGSVHGPEFNCLQAFYYPQDCPRELGTTEILPGSHLVRFSSKYMAHHGGIKDSYYAEVPAGSFLFTAYNVWHRRSKVTAQGLRNALKWNYWRTQPPTRDWNVDPDFDIATANFSMGSPRYRELEDETRDVAEMFMWLSGRSSEYRPMGATAWPKGGVTHYIDKPYGTPAN